jgi:hypothetical protein
MTFPPPAINQPALVAALGAGALASFPALQSKALSIPLSQLKLINAAAFALNMFAVSVPGRLDGKESSEKDGGNPFLNRILVAPASWAFGLWGVIFLGELVFSASQFTPLAASIGPLLQQVSVPFIMAQVFQILWAASFRPKYKGKWLSVSSAMLPSIAYSLSKAHNIFCKTSEGFSFAQYLVFFLPLSIHFGWTTAASLVNLNGAIARNKGISDKLVTVAGHVSVIGATALGAYITLSRNAPVYGGVIAWALFGIADEMRRRIAKSSEDTDKDSMKSSTKRQQILSVAGGLITSVTSLFVAIFMKHGFSSAGFDVSP